MFKRLMMGLLAASLLVAWVVVPDAEARRRQWGSILHEHNIAVDCPAFADDVHSVSDQLYGVAWVDGAWVATCRLAGLVYCNSLDPGDCPVAETNQALGAGDFLATGLVVDISAINETELDPVVGEGICADAAPEGEIWTFDKFWPVPLINLDDPAFVAHTIYYDINGNILCEAKELCFKPDAPNEDGEFIADCSTPYTGKLPCCGGGSKTLTVDVAPEEALAPPGTVTSNDGGIDCDGTDGSDCEEVYTGTAPVYDTCPSVTLWALPLFEYLGSGYTFGNWSGGACAGSTNPTCTTTAEGNPMVTANYVASYHTVTVRMINADDNDRVKLWRPRGLTYDHPEGQNTCTNAYSPCTVQVEAGTNITFRKQGDSISWGGECNGVPNSRDQCSREVNESFEVTVTFGK